MSTINIGIDGHTLFLENKTGISRFFINILKYWIKNQKFTFYIFTNTSISEQNSSFLTCYNNVKIIKDNNFANNHFMWFLFTFPKLLKKNNITWLFSPDYFLPLFLNKNILRSYVLHDISYIANPLWFKPLLRLKFYLLSVLPFKKADIVYTVSNFSKSEIEKHMKYRKNIVVTYNGIDLKDFPITRITSDSNEEYFFSVGEIFNRRHIDTVLKAFEQWCINNNNNSVVFYLRGKNVTYPYINIDNLIEQINNNLKRTAIIQIGRLSDEELTRMYRNAVATIYLSDYEGFGLPVLESLACGGNIITSNTSSIPEVASNYAYYVKDHTIEQIIEAMNTLYITKSSENLKKEKRLYVQRFSWEKTVSIISDSIISEIEQRNNK